MVVNYKIKYITLNKMGDLVVGSVPPVEVSLDLIRDKRNELLKQCDFYLMSDYPITTEVKNQWITYRQNLRDITTSINTSDLVIVEVNGELEVGGFTWPTRPQ